VRRAILLMLGAAASTTFLVAVKSHHAAAQPTGAPPTRAGAAQPHPSRHTRCKVATGAARTTPHGTLQLRVNLSDGRITDIAAVRLPAGGRSTEINGYAVPILRLEVLLAQGADVDTVTGATNTSNAYRASLQSAIDNAVLNHCG